VCNVTAGQEYGLAKSETATASILSPRERGAPVWETIGCSMTCGYIDAYSLISFNVYSSFMSGQTASTGTDAGQGKFAAAGHNFLPIPFFFIGIVVGSLLQPDRSRPQLSRVFLVIAALLAIDMGATYAAMPGWLSIMGLGTAMGMMNTTISRVAGESANVGFVTGDLKNVAEHLVDGYRRKPVPQTEGPWDTHWWRAGLLASICGTFLIGAAIGGAMVARFQIWALLAPVLVLLLLAKTARAIQRGSPKARLPPGSAEPLSPIVATSAKTGWQSCVVSEPGVGSP